MREFKEMLECERKIEEITEKQSEMRAAMYAPRSQEITGMPRGSGGASSTFDNFLIKSERLQEKKAFYITKRISLWQEAYEKMKSAGATNEQIQLISLRFFNGFSWKRCETAMAELYGGTWNKNKVFRVYRKLKEKCTKNAS